MITWLLVELNVGNGKCAHFWAMYRINYAVYTNEMPINKY